MPIVLGVIRSRILFLTVWLQLVWERLGTENCSGDSC